MGDKAVEDKDFLAAHEAKQAITKLEEQIAEKEKESQDTSYVSQSMSETFPMDEKEKLSESSSDVKADVEQSCLGEKDELSQSVTDVKEKMTKSTSTTPRRSVSVVSTPGSTDSPTPG